MPSPGPRRVRRWGIAVAVLALIAGGAAAFVLLHAPGNVSHPNLSFTAPDDGRAAGAQAGAGGPAVRMAALRVRRRANPRRSPRPPTLAPPLRVGWRYNDGALLEFPPVIYGNVLFVLDDNGWARAIDKRTGQPLWQRRVGTLAAASPAVGAREHLVFMPLLSTNPNAGQNPGNGRFVALSMHDGHVVWSRPVPAGQRVLADGLRRHRLLRRSERHGPRAAGPGRPRALELPRRRRGQGRARRWPTGSCTSPTTPARAYAVNAATGRQVWAVTTDGARFGFGSGQFYATPAVAFGRVYLGNTDGRVYSFAARTGQLAWATGTGAYVYSSAAVADPPGLGPTVYVGSYDGDHVRLRRPLGRGALDAHAPAGRSPAPGRSSATSCTSPTSATRTPRGSTCAPAAPCSRSPTARSIR